MGAAGKPNGGYSQPAGCAVGGVTYFHSPVGGPTRLWVGPAGNRRGVQY